MQNNTPVYSHPSDKSPRLSQNDAALLKDVDEVLLAVNSFNQESASRDSAANEAGDIDRVSIWLDDVRVGRPAEEADNISQISHAEDALIRGHEAVVNQDYESARTLIKHGLEIVHDMSEEPEELRPNIYVANYDLVICSYSLDDDDTAQQSLTDFIAIKPTNREETLLHFQASHIMVQVHIRQNRLEQARKANEAVIRGRRPLSEVDYHHSLALMARIYDLQDMPLRARGYLDMIPAKKRTRLKDEYRAMQPRKWDDHQKPSSQPVTASEELFSAPVNNQPTMSSSSLPREASSTQVQTHPQAHIHSPQPELGSILLACYNYVAQQDDELTLQNGDEIELIQRDDQYKDGWYWGRHLKTGKIGLFPQGKSIA